MDEVLRDRLEEAAKAGSAFWTAMRAGDDGAILTLISADGLRQVPGRMPSRSLILEKMGLTVEGIGDLGLASPADVLDDGSLVLRYAHQGHYVQQEVKVWILVATQESDRWRVDPFSGGENRHVAMTVDFVSGAYGPLPERPMDA